MSARDDLYAPIRKPVQATVRRIPAQWTMEIETVHIDAPARRLEGSWECTGTIWIDLDGKITHFPVRPTTQEVLFRRLHDPRLHRLYDDLKPVFHAEYEKAKADPWVKLAAEVNGIVNRFFKKLKFKGTIR